MMPILSVLYIVRNEQDIIGRSISSVIDIADEIVVVDTGSTDNTMNVCRQFRKTKVLSQPWEQDFSKPKNFGISQCSSDWVLCMDADEIIDKRSASAIRGAIHSARANIFGFNIHIVDHEHSFDAPPNPSSFFPSPQIRLFRHVPGMIFRGKVMESVKESMQSLGGATNVLDASIHHWLWRGQGQDYADLRVKWYNHLGAGLPSPCGVGKGIKSSDPSMTVVPPKTAIVIATMNALPATKACLSSVNLNTSGARDIIVVDNGSTDGTRGVVLDMTNRRPILLGKNEGVAKARNSGAFEAMGDPSVKHLCFLDNDTRVSPGWLEGMLRVLDDNPSMGLVGPVSCCATGPQNVADQFQKRGYEDVCPTMQDRSPASLLVRSVNRFCLLIRVDAFKKIGYFDESLGLYGFETEDYCRRAIALGFEIGVANQVYVQHRGRATLDANRHDWGAEIQRSRESFSRKWNDSPAEDIHSIGSSDGLLPVDAFDAHHSRISIVISTKDRLSSLRDCVNSITSRTSNFEMIVVDNGSTDGTDEFLAARPAIKTITGGGLNAGIRASSSEYVILLSDDVVVIGNWVGDMLSKAARGAAVVGTQPWRVHDGRYQRCEGEDFVALGPSCCLYKRGVFEDVGLLSEVVPDDARNADMCLRAAAAGHGIAWVSTKIRTKAEREYPSAMAPSIDGEKLPPLPKRFRILCLTPRFEHGVRERGASYEDSLLNSLNSWERTADLAHFDFVEEGRKVGLPAMSQRLLDIAKSFCPNLVLATPQDDNHDPRRDTLRKMSANGAKTIGWFWDSTIRFESFDKRWAPYLDFCVTTSAAALAKYEAAGFCGKAIMSGWASMPQCRRIEIRKDIDVLCMGESSYERQRAVDALKAAGVNAHVPGSVKAMELVSLINRSKVCLNVLSADGRLKETMGMNVDVAACGGALLTSAINGLREHFSEDEAASFQSAEEMVATATALLSDEDARRRMGDAAYVRAASYTWKRRLDAVIEEAGLV